MGERGNYFCPIADDAKVRCMKYFSIGIVVDRDDSSGLLYSDRMIQRSANPDADVERRRDHLACEPDLLMPREPALVDDAARRANPRIERTRQLIDRRQVLGPANACAHTNHARGLIKLCNFK